MSCTAQGPPVPSGLEPAARPNQRGPRRWPAESWAHPFHSKIQVSATGSYPQTSWCPCHWNCASLHAYSWNRWRPV